MILLIFYLGAILGSFNQCVSDRLSRNEDFIFSQSYCDHCHHLLSLFEILPFVSLTFRQRCRYCHQKISLRHIYVESLFGLVSVVLFFYCSDLFGLLMSLGMMCLWLIISLTDLKVMQVDDRFVFCLFLLGSLFHLYDQHSFILMICCGIFLCLPFIFIASITSQMGWGDVELIFVIGFTLGLKAGFYALFIAVMGATLHSLYLMVTKKASLKQKIPFCPFLAIGFFFSFLLL